MPGSCQRIDGSPNLNKCLLAYCLDGKNSMLAVKGTDGRILARSMLRLLWDKTESKPVLFLDRLYPNPCPKEIGNAILIAAKKCADQLSLDLFAKGMGGAASVKIIESLGSSCPFEYADASEGVMKDGVYTLKQVGQIPLA